MPTVRFIGDVHGKFGRYKTVVSNSAYKTIQVGDMGVGFRRWPHGEWQANPPFDVMFANDARFIRGNHDNPEVCREHKMCIQDGTVIDNMMFIGGALSIDKNLRIEDFSWWPDEELSDAQLAMLIFEFIAIEPEIMVTHECPDRIAAMITSEASFIKMDPRYASRTRFAFDRMLAGHQPKLWIFGHWHVPFDRIVDGTRFICLPELATIDIDTEKAEVVGELIPQRERW